MPRFEIVEDKCFMTCEDYLIPHFALYKINDDGTKTFVIYDDVSAMFDTKEQNGPKES